MTSSMETFFALLALCEGNSPATGDFHSQRPVTRSFDISVDLRLNKRLSKQSGRRWFKTLSRPPWRHCNVIRAKQNGEAPDSKVHGANMGPAWILPDADGPHVGPMSLAIRAVTIPWWEVNRSACLINYSELPPLQNTTIMVLQMYQSFNAKWINQTMNSQKHTPYPAHTGELRCVLWVLWKKKLWRQYLYWVMISSRTISR